MSDRYYSFRPRYWTGTTGKLIRAAGRDAQVLGAYLFTCASASSIGLYYLPLPTLCHELGMSDEDARAAIVALQDIGFAFYDFECEEVWIPEMAAQQYGPKLSPPNHQHAGVVKLLAGLRKSPFFVSFYERYEDAFNLPDPGGPCGGPTHTRLKAVPPQGELLPIDEDKGDAETDVDTEADENALNSRTFAEGYNTYCAEPYGLPQVTLPISQERAKRARSRIREHNDPAWWLEVFRTIGRTPFLRGENDRGWRCNFDFLVKPGSAERILEGGYANEPRKVG